MQSSKAGAPLYFALVFCSPDAPQPREDTYSPRGFRRPTRLRIRRTFFGDTERRAATRETFRPSRSQTLGMISSANSSLICWKVLSPTEPCDQARRVGFTLPLAQDFGLQCLQVFPGTVGVVALGESNGLVVAAPCRVRIVKEAVAVGQALPNVGMGQ